jgi:hypothetical protein
MVSANAETVVPMVGPVTKDEVEDQVTLRASWLGRVSC